MPREEKRRNYPPKSVVDAGLVFPICQQFFDGKSANAIAEWVEQELRALKIGEKFTRLHVYPTIWLAVELGLIQFNPSRQNILEERISSVANASPSGDASVLREVVVSMVRGPSSVDYLADAAASEIFRLIKKLADEKCRRLRRDAVPVHIGLGAGRTTKRVAWSLGNRLRATDELDNVSTLHFHALSSGFVSKDPLAAPVAFFNYFSDAVVDVKYVSLFSQPLVKVKDYDEIKQLPGADYAFEQAREIEIVTSSLANVDNPYSLYNYVEDQYGLTKARGRIGDVQFRGFTKDGPVKDEPDGHRAVTLFDLEDFVKMVEEQGKYLVLVVPPNQDGSSRASALLPIVTNPRLKVWSHLHLDLGTATELINLLPAAKGASDASAKRARISKKSSRRKGKP